MLGEKSMNVTVTFNNFDCDTGVPDVITTLTPFVRIFSYLSLVSDIQKSCLFSAALRYSKE
jgi:hypothetical protein